MQVWPFFYLLLSLFWRKNFFSYLFCLQDLRYRWRMKKAEKLEGFGASKSLGFLIILLSLVLLLGSWVLVLFSSLNDRNYQLEQEKEDLLQFAELRGQSLERILDKILLFLELTERATLYSKDFSDLELYVSQSKDVFFPAPDFRSFSILLSDANRKPMLQLGSLIPADFDANFMEADSYILNPENPDLLIKGPNKVNGAWNILFSRPIARNSFGVQQAGLLVQVKEMPRLDFSLIHETSRISLLRSDGKIMAVAPEDQEYMALQIQDADTWPQVFAKQSAGVFYMDKPLKGGSARWISYCKIKGLPFVITVSRTEQAMLKAWQGVFLLQMGLLILFSLLVLGLSYRLWLLNDFSLKQSHKLFEIASTDSLTALNNRRSILEKGQLEFLRAQRYKRDFSCLLVDIDHFKRYNDAFGHAVGDDVLRRFSKTLQSSLRVSDLCGRLGGEEFIVFMPETSLDHGAVLAERIRQATELVETPLGALNVSIGLSSLSDRTSTLDDLISSADRAMYQAKREGRNLVCFEGPVSGCLERSDIKLELLDLNS